MKTPLGLRIFAALTLFLVFDADARSNEAICASPPYGDTAEQYAKIRADFERAEAVHSELPPNFLTDQLRAALIEACKAKFAHGSRATYYRSGITDAEIEAQSTTGLTSSWFNARNAAALRERAPPANDEGGSRIYGLFLCSNASSSCQVYGKSHLGYGGVAEEAPFDSLADCQQTAALYSGGLTPGSDGRTLLPGGSWWECRSKRVDTWRSVQ